jgi:hypothetical protein
MKKIILLLFTFFFIHTADAQLGSSGMADAKSTGMAGTYNTLAMGSYAFGINPANIIQPQFRGDLLFILPVPQVNLRTSTSFMTMNDVNYYFGEVNGGSRYLSAEDVDRFYNKFDNGGEGSFGAAANLLSFTFNLPARGGAIGVSINDVAAGEFNIPQSAVDIPLRGNLINKIYSFDDAGFKTWWIRNYSLSYARELPEIRQKYFDRITAGVSLKLVHGFAYAGTEHVKSYIVTSERSEVTGRADYLAYTSFSEDIGINYAFDESPTKPTNLQIFPRPAGSGFGMDLGVAAVYNNIWNFSLSLTDIGSITWKTKAARFTAKGDIFLDDLANREQRDTLQRLAEGDGEYISSFSTGLPLTLRAGASYSFLSRKDAIPGILILAFDYNQGFNDLPGNTTIPRFSVAGDWQPTDWGAVRMGFSVGGIDGFNWAAGLGAAVGVIEFNIATTNLMAVPAPNSSKKISFAVNSRWRFW